MPEENGFIDFRAVKAAVSIEQVLEHYGLKKKLRPIGDDSLTGCCPIHKGTNPTQFRVSISKNCWKCFSDCRCGGNVLDFISRMEEVPIQKAAHLAAQWFNVQLDERPEREPSRSLLVDSRNKIVWRLRQQLNCRAEREAAVPRELKNLHDLSLPSSASSAPL